LIHRLVLENLKHRPVRTLLSAVAIGVQVTMILTLVGVSEGVLGDIARNSRGTGADILVRPPGSSVLAFSGDMPQGIVGLVSKEPHVVQATGTKVQSVGNFDSITGINLDEFSAMSGGFRYLEGGRFTGPEDMLGPRPQVARRRSGPIRQAIAHVCAAGFAPGQIFRKGQGQCRLRQN
jgi:putative ABC transport system permease protein